MPNIRKELPATDSYGANTSLLIAAADKASLDEDAMWIIKVIIDFAILRFLNIMSRTKSATSIWLLDDFDML